MKCTHYSIRYSLQADIHGSRGTRRTPACFDGPEFEQRALPHLQPLLRP